MQLSERQLRAISPEQNKRRYAAVKTMVQAVALTREEAPCLRYLVRKSDEKIVATGLVLHLRELDEFLHLKNGMSNEALIFTAESIIDEFGGALTFADVKVVLDNIKRGKYGKPYERLDSISILSCFREYYNERLDAAEAYTRNADVRAQREAMAAPAEKDGDMYADLRKLVGGKKIAPLTEEERKEMESDEEYVKWKMSFIEASPKTEIKRQL